MTAAGRVGVRATRPTRAPFASLATALLIGLAVLAPRTAAAADLPGPTVDFSGLMVITYPPAKPLTIRIDYTAQRIRREMTAFGTKFVFIVDRTQGKTFVLFPDLKRYAVRPLRPGEHDTARQLARNATLEKVGPDTIDGVECTKYRLQGRSVRGRNFSGFMWLTAQNIMVRMDGKTTAKDKTRRITIELRDLRIGPIDPAVFAIPAGYEKVERAKPVTQPKPVTPKPNAPPAAK